MHSKVVTINGGEAADPRSPRQDVIEELKDLLQRAEAGEIVGVAVVSYYWDGGVAPQINGITDTYKMAGALQMLVGRLTAE